MVSSVLRDARRIVVKVGSSLVTNEGRGLDETAIGEWSRQLAALVRVNHSRPISLSASFMNWLTSLKRR